MVEVGPRQWIRFTIRSQIRTLPRMARKRRKGPRSFGCGNRRLGVRVVAQSENRRGWRSWKDAYPHAILRPMRPYLVRVNIPEAGIEGDPAPENDALQAVRGAAPAEWEVIGVVGTAAAHLLAQHELRSGFVKRVP